MEASRSGWVRWWRQGVLAGDVPYTTPDISELRGHTDGARTKGTGSMRRVRPLCHAKHKPVDRRHQRQQ